MANIDNELIKGTLITAIENAIRYEHIQGGAASKFRIDELKKAHSTLTRKIYKSEEMRIENWLASSIVEGSDFGLFCARNFVLRSTGNKELTLEESHKLTEELK